MVFNFFCLAYFTQHDYLEVHPCCHKWRYFHTDVYSSITHSGQDMEATDVSYNRGLNKEAVVHIYNGILLSHKKSWNTAICDNMDGPRDNHAEWNKADRKSWKSHDITYMWDRNLKATNEQDKQRLMDMDATEVSYDR